MARKVLPYNLPTPFKTEAEEVPEDDWNYQQKRALDEEEKSQLKKGLDRLKKGGYSALQEEG